MRTLEQQIGENVRALRGERTMKWLGAELEPYLGRRWSRQAVWDAERGRRDFKAAELVALADALDVTVPQLLESDQPVTVPSGRAMTTEALDALSAPRDADRDRWLAIQAELRGLRTFREKLSELHAVYSAQLVRLQAAVQGQEPPTTPKGFTADHPLWERLGGSELSASIVAAQEWSEARAYGIAERWAHPEPEGEFRVPKMKGETDE